VKFFLRKILLRILNLLWAAFLTVFNCSRIFYWHVLCSNQCETSWKSFIFRIIFLFALDIGIGRSFKNRSFENLSWPPTGGVGGWKNGLWGLVYPVRLGQVRKAIKVQNSTPLLFISIFQIQKIDSIQGGTPEVLGDEIMDWGAYSILLVRSG